jgi:hypothetical protein
MDSDDHSRDHDLLVRIDERFQQLLIRLDAETAATSVRTTGHESDLKALRTDVDGLRTSRAQFYAVAATISFVISLLIKVFWK